MSKVDVLSNTPTSIEIRIGGGEGGGEKEQMPNNYSLQIVFQAYLDEKVVYREKEKENFLFDKTRLPFGSMATYQTLVLVSSMTTVSTRFSREFHRSSKIH